MINERLSKLLPLAAAAALLPFANGADSVPLAAWLTPIFLLRFVRTQRARVGLPIAYALVVASFAVQFRGMVPLSGAPYYILFALLGIGAIAPYAIDRWLGPRLDGGVARLLLFPSLATALQFLAAFGRFGTWGTVAYSQYGNLALMQLASLTGLWGIDFLIFAAAPIANRLWERGWRERDAVRPAAVFAAVLALVLLGGGARLALAPSPAKTVRIASLSHAATPSDGNAWSRVARASASDADRRAFAAWAKGVDDDLLARADREAAAGARLVFWDETGAVALDADEAALVARGSELAARRHIYLGMGLGIWSVGQAQPLQNKLVLIDPDGRVVWEYRKSHPVPGIEAPLVAAGDGRLRSVDTPFGKLSGVICADGDYPRLLAQAGALDADIVLDPSSDWRAIDPWHTRMAGFRAVEQGVTLIRQTYDGLSAAFNPHGVPLATMDHFQSDDHVLVAAVPTAGVRTLYARLGDWLGWLSLAAAVLLLAAAARARAPSVAAPRVEAAVAAAPRAFT